MKIRKMICLAAMFGMLLSVNGSVYAQETSRIDFDPLPVTDTWVDGTIMGENEYHYYPLEVLKTGKVRVRVQAFCDCMRADILDKDYVQLIKRDYIRGSVGEPATEDIEFYAEPGTYYVRCCQEARYYGIQLGGDYRIKVETEDLGCNEQEPNDDYKTAQSLENGVEITGVNTIYDEHDYYKFEIEDEKNVKILVKAKNTYQTHFYIYDSDMVSMEHINGGESPYLYEAVLQPGTYYIDMKIENTVDGCGEYGLRLEVEE